MAVGRTKGEEVRSLLCCIPSPHPAAYTTYYAVATQSQQVSHIHNSPKGAFDIQTTQPAGHRIRNPDRTNTTRANRANPPNNATDTRHARAWIAWQLRRGGRTLADIMADWRGANTRTLGFRARQAYAANQLVGLDRELHRTGGQGQAAAGNAGGQAPAAAGNAGNAAGAGQGAGQGAAAVAGNAQGNAGGPAAQGGAAAAAGNAQASAGGRANAGALVQLAGAALDVADANAQGNAAGQANAAADPAQ
ncbi:uncharacterized protein LTR77_004076 [Saxophila tyrrhenica]|uniref:Uncharacterized protein n=1 Tax=Saxophila tyrrhenica TaxID=1690608 RepID=A0AAV9PER2_9PEZI|nr:hypothetical protein LTR77_004076 [Saxophila tyrrhenica]